MSPPLKVTSDKIGTKLCNNILPRVILIPKLVQTSTDGTALARKSTLGSPIQDKRIDRAEMLKKPSKPGNNFFFFKLDFPSYYFSRRY